MVGGHAGGSLFECSPSPGAGYDLRIDTGEVIGSGLYWNHRPPVAFGGGTRPFRAAGPGVPRRPAQPQPEALGAERQATGCARMM